MYSSSPLKGNEPEQFSAGGIQLRSEKKACLPATMEIINPKQVSYVKVDDHIFFT
jgi:hypothetical protein